ncbi:MAG: hypothetical protein LIO75_08185 [Lachnospiraceae bacterium]|nr:hypothetical protein [Lachnospiraceae bacterium]
MAGINIFLVSRINEHKYNQDYKKELEIRARTEEKIREITERVRQELEKEGFGSDTSI